MYQSAKTTYFHLRPPLDIPHYLERQDYCHDAQLWGVQRDLGLLHSYQTLCVV